MQHKIVEVNSMQNESKPIRFGVLAKQIVRKLQAKRSRATGYLKVLPCNPSRKIPVNLSMREDRFRNMAANTTRTGKVGSR